MNAQREQTLIPCVPVARIRRLILPTILILGMAAAMMPRSGNAEPAMADPSMSGLPDTAGLYDLTFDLDDGTVVRYTLSLPPVLRRDGSQALVLVLHYGGPPSGFYGRPLLEQLIAPAFAGLDAIFIAPVTTGGDWTDPANEPAVMALSAALETAYATDPAARVITGYSMGGVGTWHFIAQRPGHFMAAIPISGFKAVDPAMCRTPVYALHSTADAIFDAAKLRDAIATLRGAGCEVQAEFIEGVDHFNLPAFARPLAAALPWLQEMRTRE